MRKQSDKRNSDNYIKLQGRQKHKLHVKQSDCKQVPCGSSNNSSSNSSGSGSGTCNHNGAAAATQVVAAGKGSYYSGNPDNIQKYFLPNLQYEVLELLPKVAHTHTHTQVYFVYTHTYNCRAVALHCVDKAQAWHTNKWHMLLYCGIFTHTLTYTHTHTYTHTQSSIVVRCHCWLRAECILYIIFNFHACFAIWFASLSRK